MNNAANALTAENWMTTVMYGVLILWAALVVIFLAVLIKRYTLYDPNRWTKATHPFIGETLALPRGVFRALITVSLLIFVLFMEIVSLAGGGLEESIEGMLTAFQMMLAFYFGSKVMHHLAAVDKRKAQARDVAEVKVAETLAGARPPADREFDVAGAEG